MSLIGKDELEDFWRSLRQSGFRPDDFEIRTTDVSMKGVFPTSGVVEVTAKGSGVSRSYNAGYGQAWTVEFENDLKGGLFG